MKKIPASDGRTLVRLSRWLKIQHNDKPNSRNPLWYYVIDGNGHRAASSQFDPSTGLRLDYFEWNGRKWALDQFYRTGGLMGFSSPIFFEDENGKTSYIAGYDGENFFNPILIEIDDSGEYVRVYEEA